MSDVNTSPEKIFTVGALDVPEDTTPEYKTPGYEAKPDDIAWGNHIGPAKLSHRHRYVAHLAALGLAAREIHNRTGYSEAWLSIVLNNDLVKTEIERARHHIFGMDPDMALKSALPDSVQVIMDTIRNPQTKDALRVDTAFRLMERTHGKAKQSIEVGGSLIKDLFAQMDAAQNARAISVDSKNIPVDAVFSEVAPAPDENEKEMEEWLTKNLSEK